MNLFKQQNETVSNNQKTLEMVFVLDTTGSMGGLIEGAKTKIWGIVNDVMQRKDRPRVKIGLVAYRDNGDAYVTQVTALTEDLDKVYSTLMDFRAEGGGDTPENVRRALAEGVEKAGWTKTNSNTAQVLFLVGDAPPQNYQQEPGCFGNNCQSCPPKYDCQHNSMRKRHGYQTNLANNCSTRGRKIFCYRAGWRSSSDFDSFRFTFGGIGKQIGQHLFSLRWW
ncbi:MAG: VWA domain-containing protein [Blastocatellia bacterium]|nr:VWA domain-containing protein [Blastocatellia bacterium]